MIYFPMSQHPKLLWQETSLNEMDWLKQWLFSQTMEGIEVTYNFCKAKILQIIVEKLHVIISLQYNI